ncbi:MAG: stage V sporulation protein AD [Lachnospiraceae bacterium]|nr:stage V sporulation protein AD [Lachnospiraceae bacterium]
MSQTTGKSSIRLEKKVYILNSASIVGKKEGEGPLGNLFDMVGEDDLFGCDTWEEAESNLQKDAVYMALGKAGKTSEDIRYLFAGDLLGQSIATSFGIASYQIPLLGVYGACSTCGESLTLGAMTVSAGYADYVACVTSSHFASAEKEFRFPLEYGNQRPLSASWTVTGSGAFILGGEQESGPQGQPPRAAITGMTVGRIVDYGLKDSMNMGACMAPAAADTLVQHFLDFNLMPEAYDRIITGDLGSVGQTVLLELLRDRGYDIAGQHMDCGIEIFDAQSQDTHAGGSGCGCSAVTLSAYILKQLEERHWKKVLFMPTGALLSKTSFNEGKSVPGIAHAVVLEAL